ncbi:hypothetical protein [Neolewinella antarctica]|uniref:hypothetical protein n=1 Tax=Neolewinella antarctica TaxID=442734 RepID=UPI001FD7FEAD|nr:hypothetical protein [Neolewinella antarctica]
MAKVRPNGEGRVDVNEFETALGVDLPAQWPVGEGGEDQFIIAPDQFVVPAGALAALVVEQGKVAAFRFGFPPRLVDVLDVVEGQDGAGDFFVAAVPEQEDVFFVGGKAVKVFFGEGLVGFDQVD